MRKALKILKYSSLGLLALILLSFALFAGLYWSADMKQPSISIDVKKYEVKDLGRYRECRGAKLRKNDRNIWELYVKGSAKERGATMGALTTDLLYYQEEVFVDQIRTLIPSDSYLGFLRKVLVMFNRNLGENIDKEYREEIYAISQFCSHEFDAIGTPYERQLNYHAAHDIGHMMQEYMLVGCTSFASQGAHSVDSLLVVGRNFDFYMGDEFAKNQIIMFFEPEDGYRFASVSWAGMIGVLSGMNEAGLTVSINAASGQIPTSSATPISLLTREILQYASTIDEAWKIAASRRTFVNESIMVASARDGKAVIIEKSPKKMDMMQMEKDLLLCTNHFQSAAFAKDKRNIENIETTDTKYRFDRLGQLLEKSTPIDAATAAGVLRDRYGAGGKDVGLGNEMTINQSIAHHSVIFIPERGLMYVSTKPWQSGAYICYDLGQIFKGADFSKEIYRSELTIPADSMFLQKDYPALLSFREIAAKIRRGEITMHPSDAERFISLNPNYFYSYQLLGDYASELFEGESEATLSELRKGFYKDALKREIPRLSERRRIEKKLAKLEK